MSSTLSTRRHFLARPALLLLLAASVVPFGAPVAHARVDRSAPRSARRAPAPAPGPRLLRAVPVDAFPVHHGFGDARFGVVEAFEQPRRADDLHVGWERVQIRWDLLQPDGPSEWNANATGQDRAYDAEIAHGRGLVGVIQGVPGWAADIQGNGNAAVPRGLALPWNDPRNYWGQFVYRAARHYTGRIDTLDILNEVNIGSGPYHQFKGSVAQYAQMLRVAYLAAHAANPHVSVHIYGDSVFADNGVWFARTVDALSRFPDARANNGFFDAAELHLYETVLHWDAVVALWRRVMRAHGYDKPIWLSETNVAPRDDRVSWAHPADHNAPLAVQPNFVVDAFAAALGLGLSRIEIYRMYDPQHFWPEHPDGLVRRNGMVRPEYYAFRTVNTWFAGVTAARYEPGTLPASDRRTLYRVVMERPGQEIQVIWNGGTWARDASVPAVGRLATVVRSDGATRIIRARNGRFVFYLPAATDRGVANPHVANIGGAPLIVAQTLPHGTHVAGLRQLYSEENRSAEGAAMGDGLGPVTSMAIAPDGSGTRVVADTMHDRVLVEDAAGRVTARIGSTGGKQGQFRGPSGVAIGPDGTLYVADQGNARVQEFDLAGRLLGGFGQYEAGAASLHAPTAVAVGPDGSVYVVDAARDAVLHYSRMGAFLGRWGGAGHGAGEFDGPGGIAVDAAGTVYVADTLNDRVSMFDGRGQPLGQIGTGAAGSGAASLRWPTAVVALKGGGVAIADTGNGRVAVAARPRTYLGAVAIPSVGTPGGLAIAPDGSYYVSDTTANHVDHLTSGGSIEGVIGRNGVSPGHLIHPEGVALGRDGNLYVANTGNGRIEIYGPDGAFVRKLGIYGSGPGQFIGPHAVSVAFDGTVWVADTDNARVQHLSATGDVLGVPAYHINGAWGVAADGQGGFYYSARYGQRVYHVDAAGHSQVWGGPGSGAGEFAHPTALAVAPDGSAAYAVDEDNARVQIVASGGISGQRGAANSSAEGLGDPVAVAAAADGTIAVLDAARHRIVRYQGASSDALAFTQTPNIPLGLAVDAAGALQVSLCDGWSGRGTTQAIAAVSVSTAH